MPRTGGTGGGGGGNPWDVVSSLPSASAMARAANDTAKTIAQSAISTAAATALAAVAGPLAAPLAAFMSSWDDLGEFLGGLFPTKQPDLPGTQRWGEILEKAGSNPGHGDFCIPRGEIVFDVNSGFPVGRWSYSRQRILPVLGFDRWGYCVFIDPEKGAGHRAEAMALVEATTPPPLAKRAGRAELMQQYHDISLPAALAGYYAPRLIIAYEGQTREGGRERGTGQAARGFGKAAAVVAAGLVVKRLAGF